MRRRALLLIAVLATACGRGTPAAAPVDARLTVADALAGSAEGFERALGPREFVFPRDHGPHSGYRSEWWYWTGNLAAASGRRFGYQLTFFRSALTAAPPERPSAWAAAHAWMAHLALTDPEGGRFLARERFAREALGLAGAERTPWTVWVEDWSARATGDGDDAFPMRLSAAADGVAVELVVEPVKPPVLQGDAGLSQKGTEPGNASYYYSMSRLAASGTITVAGRSFAVEGTSWLDREWSTGALAPGQVGWDWFALQLDDGTDLTFYRLRRDDGGTDPNSAGSLIDAGGAARALGIDDVALTVLDRWQSPRGGEVYPSAWSLEIPSAELSLEIRPLLADQELDLTFRYWEGAVDARGRHGGSAVSGVGYVELTGYADVPGR